MILWDDLMEYVVGKIIAFILIGGFFVLIYAFMGADIPNLSYRIFYFFIGISLIGGGIFIWKILVDREKEIK